MRTKNNNKPLSERTDDDIRTRARELHGIPWVLEIDDDAEVDWRGDDDEGTVLVRAWIYLGHDD